MEIAFVPDADDLLELLDNQVMAHGVGPAQKSLTIAYTPPTTGTSRWPVAT